MDVSPLSAWTAIGVTSSRPTMRFVFVIVATVISAGTVKIWTNVTIAGRCSVGDVVHY